MPNTKEDFKWTDDLVEKFMDYFKNDFSKGFPKWQAIQYFKNSIQSKQPILEYEIISVRERNNKDNLIECKYRGMFNPDYYEIHSVKRLSDNSIYTIGDEVNYGVIQRFLIDGTWGINVHFTNGNGATLSAIVREKKQPLFTTTDGKDIYEGDKMVLLSMATWATHKMDVPKEFKGTDNHFLYFSTEEAANEYVNLHKPVLSAQDIIDYFESWIVKPSEYTKNIIIKLAKQKINGI